jgi:hypothetical protein
MSKIKTRFFREPYYKTTDGLHQLLEASDEKNDTILRLLVYDLREQMDYIKKHLDKNYLWD